ncbi:hypothetical protein K501DRAFT_223325 [Backusella circina FSU 941]|nr:hypothetical protein K501DRAFT_223325 [Backusella circina FSU 941]
MSEAKVLQATTSAVRAKSKPENTRVVYKNVVGSPFLLKWPTILPDLSESIFTQLLKTLEPIGHYKKSIRENKKQQKNNNKTQPPPPPELSHRLHIGLNEVTRFLESYIDKKRNNTPITSEPIIYICKREIKPVLLCQHILTMAALAQVRVAQMPAGAENKLGKALGIRRAAVVVVEWKPEDVNVQIPLVDAPWLSGALAHQPVYASVASKTLQTAAPMQSKKEAVKRKLENAETAGSNKKPCIEKK